MSDVKKEINFCKKTGVRILGVVENMAGFVCPNCAECTDVFSKNGGLIMAAEFAVPFLGSVPIDPMFISLIEEGKCPKYPQGTVIAGQDMANRPQRDPGSGPTTLVGKYNECSLRPLFEEIVQKMVENIPV